MGTVLGPPEESFTENQRQNVIMHDKLERRLVKVKLLEAGTLVKLSNSEQEDWAGADHYVLMQLEENLVSEST